MVYPAVLLKFFISIYVNSSLSFSLRVQISLLYRMSQEECEILRESVPYVKLYRYTQNTYIQS